ncbi:MAG: DUF2262 domain-containing protein [Anaerolineae bacterium]|nr:DUF2262 domain-containing protein [Anaerolineae bacterium]
METLIADGVLGELRYNEALNSYDGYLTLSGDQVEISLSLDECADLGAFLESAREFAQGVEERTRLAQVYAAQSLLELQNSEWASDGEVVTETEFISRMRLTSILLYPDHSFELYYDDGDLFWGHTIVVVADDTQDFTVADIAG